MARPKGSKTRLPFRQSEIMRGIRACAALGLSIEKIEIHPSSGTLVIVPAAPASAASLPVVNANAKSAA